MGVIMDNFYVALNIMDRINDEVITKFGCPCRFSKYMNRSRAYWGTTYNRAGSFFIQNLVKWAKAVDLSVEYLLTGKNKSPYRPVAICYDDLILEYSKFAKDKLRTNSRRTPQRLRVLMHFIKNDRSRKLDLRILLDFEDLLNIPAYKLVFKEI